MYPFRWMTQDQMILKSMCHKEVYLPVDHRRKPVLSSQGFLSDDGENQCEPHVGH